ncbi:DUF1643 domain-containing protein [Clostridium senegalense]|uniref:DUF1643 domain-containing protein n=1 Tax=Clostridium senegalense TaxID=1465809 RepID=UPI001C11162D|nr:DUF1643 domain-containing protein [Clostridium senegalense]MBU5227844.1 DUF1643 domain-containing protein [Clostridium senegalense]
MIISDIKTQKVTIYTEVDCIKDGKGNNYRYRLYKKWSDKPNAVAIMLNPSKASLVESDNTVTNITNHFYNRGFGSLTILNLFSYMNTDSKKLINSKKEYEDINIEILKKYIRDADEILVGWGIPKSYNKEIRHIIKKKIKLVEEFLSENNYEDIVYSFRTNKNKALHPVVIRNNYKYKKHFE